MGIFENCLLACDIDGTLISGDVLPERNIQRIKYFVSEGGAFSLSTGRALEGIGAVTSKIDCIAPSVLSNGCVIYDFKQQKAIEEKNLPCCTLQMARLAMEQKIGFEMHSADGIFVPSRCDASDLHESYENMPVQFVPFSEAVKHGINKVIYFIEHESQIEYLKKTSEKYKNDCTFYSTCAFICGEKQNYFEQLPSGVSKAQAISRLREILNIKKGGYFAIGDYYNDLEMIKAADISAVPCESPDDIKAAATVTVGSAADGAVADFIDCLEEFLKNGC